MLSLEAKTPCRRPRTSSACPMQTPTSSPSGRNNPPPDRPCSGARAVMKKSRSSRLSLSSNQRASTSRRGPAREILAQVDADRGDDRVDGGLATRRRQAGDVRQGGQVPRCGGSPGRRRDRSRRRRPRSAAARPPAAPASAPARGCSDGARRRSAPDSPITCDAVRTRVSPSTEAMIVPLPCEVPRRTTTVGRNVQSSEGRTTLASVDPRGGPPRRRDRGRPMPGPARVGRPSSGPAAAAIGPEGRPEDGRQPVPAPRAGSTVRTPAWTVAARNRLVPMTDRGSPTSPRSIPPRTLGRLDPIHGDDLRPAFQASATRLAPRRRSPEPLAPFRPR